MSLRARVEWTVSLVLMTGAVAVLTLGSRVKQLVAG